MPIPGLIGAVLGFLIVALLGILVSRDFPSWSSRRRSLRVAAAFFLLGFLTGRLAEWFDEPTWGTSALHVAGILMYAWALYRLFDAARQSRARTF